MTGKAGPNKSSGPAPKGTRRSAPPSAEKAAELAGVRQELHDHQAELRAQNEDLRRAHGELERSRDRYYELYDLAPIAYLTLNASGRIVEANLHAARLLGVDRARVYNRSLASFMSLPNADTFHRFVQDVCHSVGKRSQELTLFSARGDELCVQIDAIADAEAGTNAKKGGDRPATPLQVRCVLIDLSDLRRAESARRSEEERSKEAEARLRESEARFRQIAETIEDIFFVEERDGSISYASEAYERLTGRRRADLYARRFGLRDAVDPADAARVAAARDRLHKGEPFDEEYRLLPTDGPARWVRERSFSVEDEQDRPKRVVGVIHDVTVERELEEQLRQAQKMEAVGALASGIAHDFNNVLHTVLGFSKMALAEEGLSTRAQDHMRRVGTAATRGADLTKQLLAFARKERADPAPLAVDAAVQAAAMLVERLVTEQVRVVLDLKAPEIAVRADSVQLEQILMNLATNARDAMPEGGTLRIATDVVEQPARLFPGLRAADRYVRITVADTGSGMDEATRRRIFEPFFTTKPVGRGTGLGLSTVFAVTHQLGGHVDAHSTPGHGASFTVLLPSCDEASLAPAPRSGPRELGPIRARALLVEDEPLVRMTVRRYLDELGLDVVEADGVETAQSLFVESAPPVDVLVTDVVMPVMTGPRLAEILRQQVPDLRVLFISANPPDQLGKTIRHGATALLQKPFGKQALGRALEDLLDGPLDAPDPKTRQGSLEHGRP